MSVNMKFTARVSGLILDERTGKVVLSKLFGTIGYSVATYFFCRYNLVAPFNEMLWIIYLGYISGQKLFEKLIGMKYGQPVASTYVPEGNVNVTTESTK